VPTPARNAGPPPSTTGNAPTATAHTHPTEGELGRALILVKRATLVRLRDERRIDDAVLRRVQETLDAEEVRLELRDLAIRARPLLEPGPAAPPVW
jgi:hypothetical protein